MTSTTASPDQQQLALARRARATPNGPQVAVSSTLSRQARQTVPAFLQKLYEMVNELSTNDIIRWSDKGDSFYVYDQERFAREVLGRWFKHQNFSSFVRQLNMYGFHKVPHLQQGVLKQEHDTETWHFEQPNFLRGQPDLLCMIQRKKQAPAADSGARGGAVNRLTGVQPPAITNGDLPGSGVPLITAGPGNGTSPLQHGSSGELINPSQIMQGIAAVKQHQAAISAELADLRSNNELLWKEALAARERHKKHQDTINKIMKFLGAVFGQQDGGQRQQEPGRASPVSVIPRKRQRLMIEDGRHKGKSFAVPVPEASEEDEEYDDGPPSPARFATIDTPLSTGPSEAISPAPTENSTRYPFPHSGGSVEPRDTPMPEPPPNVGSTATDTKDSDATTTADVRPLTPTTFNALMTTSSGGQDAVQSAINQLVSSPEQMTRLLQMLSSQQSPSFPISNYPTHPSNPPGAPGNFPHSPDPNSQKVAQFESSPWDPTHFPQQQASSFLPQYSSAPPTSNQHPSAQPLPLIRTPSHDGQDAGDADHDAEMILAPLFSDAGRLQKTWTNAAEIDADVNALQGQLDTLLASMGMDPSSLAQQQAAQSNTGAADVHTTTQHGSGQTQPSQAASPPSAGTTTMGPPADFDFDAFLHDFQARGGLASTDGGAGGVRVEDGYPAGFDDEHISAFLDEVASQASGDAASPAPSVSGRSERGESPARAKGKKRKSDAARLSPKDLKDQ